VVLGLQLVGVLLQAKALVSAGHGGLLKQGARVLGIACHERPTRVVGRKLGVVNDSHALTPHHIVVISNGEQGDGGAVEAQQVVLTKLHEGLVDNPLQGVIEVVAPCSGEPSSHARVIVVSCDVHVDPEASTPKLMVWVATVCGSPHVTKTVQHVLEQGCKPGMVQPFTTVPSIGFKVGVGVVIHLSKTKEK
jgi:hypothetical protein